MEFYTDGVIQNKYDYVEHEDKLYVQQTQASEKAILDRNAELRKNPGSMNDLTGKDGKAYGRLEANIPNIIFYKYLEEYQLMTKEGMARFLQTTIGKACLVNDSSARIKDKPLIIGP